INIKIEIKCLLPGIMFTIISWYVVSKGFNIYINNFSRYSVIYGSIAAIFVFGIWLFLLSSLILIGSQINAVLYDKEFMARLKGDM
ncbi:MAG: YhjD/YihY/BrkB family envelope integrity protein, partial [Clostridia bacterium]|nr:YhjD/YihY/BrkB family envelope integrity protein [Clostridia bacterium]